jgi:hypothetical protein
MLSLFRNGSNFTLLLLLLLTLLLWGSAFWSPPPVIGVLSPVSGVLWEMYVSFPRIASLAGMLTAFATAVFLNNLSQEFNLVPRNSFIVGAIYLTLTAMLPCWLSLHPALLINLILVPFLLMLYRAYHGSASYKEVFNAGFLTGIAALTLPVAVFFFTIIWISFLIYRNTGWREWIISLTGLSLPLLFRSVWLFINDRLTLDAAFMLPYFKRPDLPAFGSLSVWEAAILIFLACLALPSVFRLLSRVSEKVISLRKMYIIIFWMLVMASGIFLTSGNFWRITLPFVFLPLSTVFAHYYHSNRRSFISELLFFSLMVLLVLGRFFITDLRCIFAEN